MSTRNRMDDVSSADLRPDSLVGSYFLGNDQQGMVVAEPTPGVYLVEMADWIVSASTTQRLVGIAIQRLVGIEAMAEWRFFDTAERMRNTWENEAARSGRTTKPAAASGKARTPPGTTGKAARRSRSGQDCAGAAGRRTRNGDPRGHRSLQVESSFADSRRPPFYLTPRISSARYSGPRALRFRRARPPNRAVFLEAEGVACRAGGRPRRKAALSSQTSTRAVAPVA